MAGPRGTGSFEHLNAQQGPLRVSPAGGLARIAHRFMAAPERVAGNFCVRSDETGREFTREDGEPWPRASRRLPERRVSP